MKRLTFSLLIIAFICSIAHAKYSGGTGEPNAPYQIANTADLLTLANDANDYNKCFIMTADIDLDPCLPGGQVFTTAVIARGTVDITGYDFIGNVFSGVFDGAGYKIINLTIDTLGMGNDFLGLFGDVNGGEVKNLGLENVKIISNGDRSTCCGALAGRLENGVISSCFSTGNVNANTDLYSWFVGGLVAEIVSTGSITNSFSTCNVRGWNDSSELGVLAGRNSGIINDCFSSGTATGDDSTYQIGGLVGSNNGYISNSFSTSSVTAGNGSFSIGGLAGYNFGGSVIGCFSTGSVNGGENPQLFGGFIGNLESGSANNCYSTGAITGGRWSFNIGGFAGVLGEITYANISNCYSTGDVNVGNDSSTLGGFIGQICNGDVTNCYSTGDVNRTSGEFGMGGFVGYKQNGVISRSFYLNSAGPYNGYGIPVSDEQMKQQSSFVDWDFTNIWWMRCEGMNYPKLNWQAIPAADFVCPDGVSFIDYSFFAERWMNTNCTANNDCDGADFDSSGTVDIDDLAVICDYWLQGL